MMAALTPPKQVTLSLSVVLAVAAVMVRVLAYTGVQMPAVFPAKGSLLLLLAYLVLVAGILYKGV